MDFNKLKKLVYEEYKKTGHLEKWERARELLKSEGLEGIVDLAEIGLIVTEVAEAMEEVRDQNPEKESKELAGIIIRILNYCNRKGYNIEKDILAEHKRNLKRPKLHGRKMI